MMRQWATWGLAIGCCGLLTAHGTNGRGKGGIATTRTDSAVNSASVTVNGTTTPVTDASAAWVVMPSTSTGPDFAGAEAEIRPAPNSSSRAVRAEAEVAVVWTSAAGVLAASADAAGVGHTFTPAAGTTPTTLRSEAHLGVRFGSRSTTPPNLTFATAPTAVVKGPAIDLAATLTSTTVGSAALPQLTITGTVMTASGIAVINQTTTTGRAAYFGSIAAPTSWTLEKLNVDVPAASIAAAPTARTGFALEAEFSASFR